MPLARRRPHPALLPAPPSRSRKTWQVVSGCRLPEARSRCTAPTSRSVAPPEPFACSPVGLAAVDAGSRTWWARPGLEVRRGRLTIAGRDAEALAREHGTPLYAHDCVRVQEQAQALEGALDRAELAHRVRLALKAQRDPDLLRSLRERVPFVGMDVCSPGELRWALDHGWAPQEISYTGTNLSERDLDD